MRIFNGSDSHAFSNVSRTFGSYDFSFRSFFLQVLFHSLIALQKDHKKAGSCRRNWLFSIEFSCAQSASALQSLSDGVAHVVNVCGGQSGHIDAPPADNIDTFVLLEPGYRVIGQSAEREHAALLLDIGEIPVDSSLCQTVHEGRAHIDDAAAHAGQFIAPALGQFRVGQNGLDNEAAVRRRIGIADPDGEVEMTLRDPSFLAVCADHGYRSGALVVETEILGE